ncbi:hypothetical protein HYT02_02915 [Candidatus Gottesmanbacteria bacterium]|nr:hypothetical protein [Candidatus Gottesmanbacteria bacterium]
MFEGIFRKKKQQVAEYFVAIKLDESSVSASVFTVVDGKTVTYGKGYEDFTGDWENAINATDHVVSKAAGEINLTTIKKAVFGFPPYYLENEKISQIILPQLKKLTSELELTPSGFVVLPEAVNFMLEKRDGGPPTNILVGVSKNHLVVSLFRGGKIVKQTVTQITDRVADTVDSILAQYSDIDIFPTRIILYSTLPLENIHSQFVNYSWQKNPKFLHFPKVELLDNDFCLEAVVEAAASELSTSFSLESIPETTNDGQGKQVSPSDLGFVSEPTSTNITTPPSLSFSLPFSNSQQKNNIPKPQVEDNNVPQKPRVALPNFSKINLKTKMAAIAVVIAFVFIGGVYYAASYTLPTATITLVVDPKVMGSQKEVGVNSDLLTPSNETNEIPGTNIGTEVSGSRTTQTTGTKLVGDSAKGTITIYNKTSSERTFEKGTNLTSGSLSFTADDVVTVPGASETLDGDELKPTYGKATIGITASKIGAEGNLAAQTEFTVEEFSNTSYTARNVEALAGGTSREISIVSAKDQENLMNQLHDELKNQAANDLIAKLQSGEHLLNESLIGTVTSRKFSNEVGEETKELTLTLTESFKGLVYKDADFTTLMEKTLLTNIPEGYEFKPNETVLGVSDAVIDKSTNKVRFTADFEARLFPKVNSDKIKSDVAGVSLDKLESYMKTVKNVAGYEIDVDSPLSLFDSKVPARVENIEITIQSRE